MMDVNFSPFPLLETERLRLRKMTRDDADEVFFLRSDPGVMRYIDRIPALNVEDAISYIDNINSLQDKNEVIMWAITLRPNNKLIGTVCLFKIERENYRCQVGYILHPDFHRKGIMTVALNKVLGFGFNTLKFHSITADVNPANDASRMLLLSLGFKQEAYFRENFYFNGRFLDTAIFCIISPV
jgi:ribosomal-protein-alanine N-acetyltransferase